MPAVKGKAAGVQNAVSNLGRLLAITILGGLCGVGLVWTLSAASPVTKPHVQHLSLGLQRLASHNPLVALGLLLGGGVTLLWQAVKR